MHDVVVVGGGPAGSRTAALLARGADVLVLEEHRCSGIPMQCAGLITDDVIKLSGVTPDILSTILGAEVVFPDGSTVRVSSEKPIARAVDRAGLDSRMADAALSAGAEFSYGTRYISHSTSDRVSIVTSTGDVESSSIVGADGHSSKVAKSVPGSGPEEYLRGIQADVAVRMEHQDMFRVRLGSRYAPGFFTWEIPCGDFTRIGLCTSWSAGPPAPYLKKLLSDIGVEERIIGMHSGKIPLGNGGNTVADRTALVGDAACQVKPVSGGGLYPGLTAAGILAETLLTSVRDGDFTKDTLVKYENDCDKAFGSELRAGRRLRRMFTRMSDEDLNAAGRYASRDDVRSILDGIDIDHPSRVVRELVRHPAAMLSAIPLIMRCIV